MKAGIRYTAIAMVVSITMALQPLTVFIPPFQNPQAFTHQTFTHQVFTHVAHAEENSAGTIYLPLASKPGPPAFEISMPANNTTVAGTTLVAVQPLAGQKITRVVFKAGETVIGTDETAADGFRAFFDARKFAAGTLSLTATAVGGDGESSKSISVQVFPNPPASGTVNNDGSGIYGNEGGVVGLCPGAAPAGTQISVTALYKEEIQTEHKLDWNQMNITFLGAHRINANRPVSPTFCNLSTVGYGNSVGSNSSIVQFQILPDADGDGVSELVAVNGGSAAPNGDVIADAIPEIKVKNMVIEAKVASVYAQAAQTGLHGKPGDMIKITATGFNPLSPNGNLIIFQSLVTTESVTLAGNVSANTATGEQTFEAAVPMLPVGAVQIFLKNQGTNKTVGPLSLMIDTPNPLTRPKEQVIDALFTQVIQSIESGFISGEPKNKSDLKESLLNKTLTARTQIHLLFNRPELSIQQALTNQAILIENSGILGQEQGLQKEVPENETYEILHIANPQKCLNPHEINLAKLKLRNTLIEATYLTDIGELLASAAGVFGLELGLAILGIKTNYALLFSRREYEIDESACPSDPPQETAAKSTCKASQVTTGQLIATGGMGTLSSAGGSGCGNTLSTSSRQVVASSTYQSSNAPITVKVYIDNKATDFTGVTDESGYFYIPYIPEGKPFTAIAFDPASGETRNATGVGPKNGESVRLLFDFTEGEDPNVLRWDGGGDGKRWADAKNWAGDTLPIEASRVIIAGAASQTVLITGSVQIRSLQSDAAITLDRASALVVHHHTVISNAFSMEMGSGLIVDGSNASFTASGKVTFNGGEVIASDGGQIILPQATEFFANVEDSAFYTLDSLDDDALQKRIKPCSDLNFFYDPRRNICAIGVGSRVNLSGITTLIGISPRSPTEYSEVRALRGGFVDLGGLQAILQGHVRFLSSRTEGGTGDSRIDLSSLIDTGPNATHIFAGRFGQIDMGKLTRLHKASLEVYESSRVSTTQLTELSASSVIADKNSLAFDNVTQIDHTSFTLSGGAKLTFPAVTSIADGDTLPQTEWNVKDDGSQLVLPALETLTGNTFVNASLSMNVQNGGQITLSKLAAIATGHVQIHVEGNNSLVNLASLAAWISNDRGGSSVKVSSNGRVSMPKLTDLQNVSLILDNDLNLNTSQITRMQGGSIETSIVSPDFQNLSEADDVDLVAKNGAKLSLPKLTAYRGLDTIDGFSLFKAEGFNSLIDLPNLVTFEGKTFTNATLDVSAIDGGSINLPKVATITKGKICFVAQGTKSLINLSSLNQLSLVQGERGTACLKAESKGVIDLKNNALTVAGNDFPSLVEVTLRSAGLITLTSLTLHPNSILSGIGTIPGHVTNHASVSPGDATGVLQIKGTYAQTTDALLKIELKGKLVGILFDQLSIQGNATLAGSLQVDFIEGYRPAIGDTFEILKASTVSGSFATVTVTGLDESGRKAEVSYTSTSVVLQIVAG